MRLRLRTLLTLLLNVGLVPFLATPAAATPVTWEFQGAVTAVFKQSDFPVGTPVTFDWIADTATPNACSSINPDPNVGYYLNQQLIEHIGGQTYNIGGILTIGTNVALGCSGFTSPGPQTVELRLVFWSGPSLSDGTPVVPFWPCCTSPAILFNPTAPGGAYPVFPPRAIFFQGPDFVDGTGVSGNASIVPEPATMILLGSGLTVVAARRRGRPRR